MVRLKLDRSRRGHSSPAVSAWPTKAFMPVPEYWIDVRLPIAVCAACNTVLAVLGGLLQPATPTITPANSQSFLAMPAPLEKDVESRFGGQRTRQQTTRSAAKTRAWSEQSADEVLTAGAGRAPALRRKRSTTPTES